MVKKRTAKNTNPVIVVAIIGLIGTVTSAILSSPVLVAKIQNAPAPTLSVPVPTSTIPAPTFTSPAPTASIQSSISSQQDLLAPLTGPDTILENSDSTSLQNEVLKYEVDTEYSSDFDLKEDVIMPYDFFNETVYIINTNIDPVESLGKFQEEAKHWDVISSKLKLVLWVQNIQKGDGLDLQIKKDVSIIIKPLYNRTTNPYEHVNVMVSPKESGFIIPVTGGSTEQELNTPEFDFIIPITGGETYYHIVPVMIESTSNDMIHTSIMEYDFVNLKPGETGPFELSLTCGTPGFYLIQLTLQVYYAGESHDVEVVPANSFVCPESITVWDYKDASNGTIQYNKWKKLGDYFLQDGEYISLPADSATATPIQ